MDKKKAKQISKDAIVEAIAFCGGQVTLAEKAGVSQSAISKYNIGTAMPTGRVAIALSRAVDGTIPRERFSPLNF